MILRPFLYDVRKTLLSKTVLILIGIMLLVSLTIIPLSRSNSFTFFQSQVNVAYYYHNGYNFLLGAYNQYGDPVVGANLNLTLSTVPNSTVTNPSRVASLIGTTNSSGLAFFPFNVKYFDYWVSVETSTSSGNFGFGSMIQNNTAQGNVRLLNGQAISTVTNKANASRTDIQVFYAAPFGAKPLNYQVRFRLFSSPKFGYNMSLYAVSQTKPVDGNLTYYHHLFDPALPPGNETTWVGFGLYAPNGTIVDQPLLVPYTSLRVPPTPINVSNVAQAFFSTLLSYVVPSWLSLGPTPLMGRIG